MHKTLVSELHGIQLTLVGRRHAAVPLLQSGCTVDHGKPDREYASRQAVQRVADIADCIRRRLERVLP